MPFPPAGPRRPPRLEALEDRCLLTSYTLTPVVPTIDAAQQAFLGDVLRRGVAAGNRPNVFARAGDSISAGRDYLTPLGLPSAGVDRGGDGSLNDTLGFFRSGLIGIDNAFTRAGVAAVGGATSFDVLARLGAEIAVTRPSFVLVMVGTNDDDLQVPLDTFRQNLTAIVQFSLNNGVVPVLSTIPDSYLDARHDQQQPGYNQTIEDVGESLQVPVWNYWRALQRLPSHGISADGVHPTVSPFGGGDLSDFGLHFGYNVRNLTALQTLDKLRRVLLLGQPPDLPSGGSAWAPLGAGSLALNAGDSTGFQVEVIDATSRSVLFRFDPFPGFTGGVRTALGDVNGDGVPDLVAAAGPGGPPHVEVFDGRGGALIGSFYAYAAGLTSGLNVAAGDVDGDGRADVVVAAGRGGQGHVEVFSGATLGLIASYLPFAGSFGGTTSLAVGDVDGGGRAEVAVGVASGGPPHVKVFEASGGLLASYFAYAPALLSGVRLAMIDRDGDGRDELVTASGQAAYADVRISDALTQQVLDVFFEYEPGFRRGLTLGR